MTQFEKTVKLNPNKSRFIKTQEHKQEFEKNVEEAIIKNQNYNEAAERLGQAFLSIMIDKTLVIEKTLPIKEKEENILRQIIDLGIKFNNDLLLLEEGKEGMGSIILNSLLFKIVLMFRDRINQLEFQVSELNKNK